MGSVSYLRKPPQRAQAQPDSKAAERPESLLRVGHNCCTVARAERLGILVDGESYFRAFYQAALRARRSITILGWDFNSQTRLHFDPVPPGGPPALLGEFLNYLAHRRRGLHVHVLNWDYPMVFGADREFPPLYGFGWRPHRRVHLRYDDTHPIGGSQHQKIILIDDKLAFSGGYDLTVRRWDTPEHRPVDPRRVAYGKPYPPFHDLMVCVDGEAARALAGIARYRWENATGDKLKSVSVPGDPWPPEVSPELTGVEIGIARTMPPRGEAPAVREVERLYLDMIAAARRSIYIENQYFTAPRLASALAERLSEPNGPEVVLVLRLLSHGWLEEHTMHVLRTGLIQKLVSADRHGRFRVYYPHVPGLPDGWCVDVHSKLMIVDDAYLRIGSANLCNRSMGIDTECDVLIESRGDPHVASTIGRFRDRLVGEHLGVSPGAVAEATERAGSLNGAIAGLASEGRSLRRLDDRLPEWPEAIVNVAAMADPDEPISLDFLALERAETAEEEPLLEPTRPMPWLRLIAGALVIGSLAALWRYTPLAQAITAENITDAARHFASQAWAPLAIIAAYTPASLVMFPRPLITLAAVVAFGPWIGFLLALAGVLTASAATYAAGMRFKRDTVRRLAGPKLDAMIEVMCRNGLVAVTFLRLVPIAPFAVEGIVAGAVRLKLFDYLAGSALGMLPGLLTATIFGHQIENALVHGGPINWWLVGGVMLFFAAAILGMRRWFIKMNRRLSTNEKASHQPG
jgi:phospholipase D1/2